MKKLRTIIELGINLLCPWLAYTLTEPVYGEFAALVASSIPPLLWCLFELARNRRIDALSCLILAGIGLSMLGLALGGDAKLLLIRESLISGLIGLAFLVSLFFKRPLVFFLARATVVRQDSENGAQNFYEWWQKPVAQQTIRNITLVWGLGLSAEAVLRTWLAWHWEPQRFLAIAPTLGYLIAGALGLWTFYFVRRLKNREIIENSASADSE